MTAELEIAALETRLAIAEAERDGWRAAGRAENYLAACAMVESLAVRLERLQSTPRGTAALAAAEPPGDSSDERARQMAELCISFNGRDYVYRGYRYERLGDAVNYARLERSRAVPGDAPATKRNTSRHPRWWRS